MTVLGFHVQCGICPQRAFVDAQPDGDWVCPRCSAVTPEARPAEPALATDGLVFPTETDPLAAAILAEIQAVGAAAKVTAQVGDRVFVLDSYTQSDDGRMVAGWYDRAELVKRCALPRCPVCGLVVHVESVGDARNAVHAEDRTPVCRKPIEAFINTVPPTPIKFWPQHTAHSAIGEWNLVDEIGEFGALCLCTETFWAASKDTAYQLHIEHSVQDQPALDDDEYPLGLVQG